jgi:hypothetical protein
MSGVRRRVPEPGALAIALARRLLAETGVSDGALAYPRPEVIAALVAAVSAGKSIAVAAMSNQDHCRVCGCTRMRACVSPPGATPCHWVTPTLCSACAPYAERG